MTKKLEIIRGLPASGKTTAANRLTGRRTSTDDFFMRDREIVTSPGYYTDACCSNVPKTCDCEERWLDDGYGQEEIIVEEYYAYDELVKKHGFGIVVENHKKNQARVAGWMFLGEESIIVDNTFVCRWEMQPYLDLAKEHGYEVNVTDLFDGGCDNDQELVERSKNGNEHNVPLDVIQRMRASYEHDWESGNPLPPWERK